MKSHLQFLREIRKNYRILLKFCLDNQAKNVKSLNIEIMKLEAKIELLDQIIDAILIKKTQIYL